MDAHEIGKQSARLDDLGGRMARLESRFDDLSLQVQKTQLEALQAQVELNHELGDLKTSLASQLGELHTTVLERHYDLSRYVYDDVKPVVEDIGKLKGRVALIVTIIVIILGPVVNYTVTEARDRSSDPKPLLYLDPRAQRNDTLRTVPFSLDD